MEGYEVRLRKAQRDYILKIISSESPREDFRIQDFLVLKKKITLGLICEGECNMSGFVELNSIVSVLTSFGYKNGLKLVLPEEANIRSNKLSIFSSLGCAIFGRKVGDRVTWFFQGKKEYVEIIEVHNTSNGATDFLRE